MTYTRRRSRSQGPSLFVLLLTAACLAGAFLLLTDPGAFDQLLYPVTGRKSGPSAAPPTAAKEASTARVPKTTAKSTPVVSSAPPAAATAPPSSDVPPVPPHSEEAPAKLDLTHARIKKDSTVAYSSTSSRSAVVGVLDKDAMVEINFELINSEGRWSMVRTEGLNQPVFVRSEDLDRSAKRE
jgi:hypothetical protein